MRKAFTGFAVVILIGYISAFIAKSLGWL